MVISTRGFVLRAVRYGDTSLIVNIFTLDSGVKTFIVQGIRSSKSKKNPGLLQPAMLLDLEIYEQPGKTMQRIREFAPLYHFRTLHEDITKRSIAVFCAELLLRVLLPDAVAKEIFVFTEQFVAVLDTMPGENIGNMPVYFTMMCGRYLGFDISGLFSDATPFADMGEGCFTARPPSGPPYLSAQETEAMSGLLKARDLTAVTRVRLSGEGRANILEWYIAFLKRHTHHMGEMVSLHTLRAVFH